MIKYNYYVNSNAILIIGSIEVRNKIRVCMDGYNGVRDGFQRDGTI